MNNKKTQQFDFAKNKFFFHSHLKDCNKLIFSNFFLSIGLFFLLFKIIEIVDCFQHNLHLQWKKLGCLSSLGVDTSSHLKIIGGIIFSIFLLFCSLIYIFWLRHKASNTLTKTNFNFVWNFYFALIPIFGLIYLFIWTKVMKKKYSLKTEYSFYYSLLSLIIINMLLIIVYWMIYMIKGGIAYINMGNKISMEHFCYEIPTIFDLFISPIKAIIGWFSFLHDMPAFSELP